MKRSYGPSFTSQSIYKGFWQPEICF